MWTWEAGGAPPAGPGNARSVFTAITCQSATALPAGSALTGVESPPNAATSAKTPAIDNRLDFIYASFRPLLSPLCLWADWSQDHNVAGLYTNREGAGVERRAKRRTARTTRSRTLSSWRSAPGMEDMKPYGMQPPATSNAKALALAMS